MSSGRPSGKEPMSSSWKSAQIKSVVQKKLKAMDLEFEAEQLKDIIALRKGHIIEQCPSNRTLGDFAIEQVTKYVVDLLANDGTLAGDPHFASRPEGMSMERFYRQQFGLFMENMRAKLLTETPPDDGSNDQVVTDLMEFATAVWEAKMPDLSKRQDRDPRFKDWMSEAKETIEVLWALEDKKERSLAIKEMRRERKDYEQSINDNRFALSEQQRFDQEANITKKLPKSKTKKAKRSFQVPRDPNQPESSQWAAARTRAQLSSTDSTKTLSITTRSLDGQESKATLDPRKKQKQVEIKAESQKTIDERMKDIFGSDSDEAEMSTQHPEDPAQIQVDGAEKINPPEMDIPTALFVYQLPVSSGEGQDVDNPFISSLAWRTANKLKTEEEDLIEDHLP